jgi:hypothetical protein
MPNPNPNPGTLRTQVEPAGPACRVFFKAEAEGEYVVSVLMEKRIQLGLRRGLRPLTHAPFRAVAVRDPTLTSLGDD